jgi:NAD(P)-dependent dehydrogenase (short-subunit alcohol dehydrogenase family)
MNPKGAVLVTGAASGIGRACVDEYVAQGHAVIGWDLAEGDTPEVDWHVVDVTDWTSLNHAATALPPLHAVVTCAGIGVRGPMVDTTPELWRRVLSVNVEGTALTALVAFDALRRGSGTLVTIGSITASSVFKHRAPYSASKAAVVMLTRSLANEWAEYGIRAVCVSPGFTRTPMLEESLRSGLTDAEVIMRHTPQRVFVEPSEIAASIRALTSDDFARVTGGHILVDAGWDSLTGF